MPSIPQSLLWISLVVLWLFVLVPMLISKRDAVRRTSDVALATRVLNSGTAVRLRRRGPAAGHRSDPDWRPSEDDLDDDIDDDVDADLEDARGDIRADDGARAPQRSVVKVAAAATQDEPDYLDVDVVEDSEALPAGRATPVAQPAMAAESGTPTRFPRTPRFKRRVPRTPQMARTTSTSTSTTRPASRRPRTAICTSPTRSARPVGAGTSPALPKP